MPKRDSDSWDPAYRDYADSLDKTADSAKKATKALKGYLSPIDEINNYDSGNDDSSTDGTGGGGYSNPTPGQMFEEIPIKNSIKGLADKIKKLIQQEDWEGLGKFMAQGINKGLKHVYNAINWKKVGPRITKFCNAFTRTFNSLVDNIDWDLLGRTVGAGVNTIVNTLNLLITGIDWKNLGKKFAEGITGFVREVNWKNLGNLLGNQFMISWDIFNGMVYNLPYTEIGKAFADLLNGTFEKVSFGEIADTLATGLNGAFESLYEFTTNFEWTDLVDNIADGINTYAGTYQGVLSAFNNTSGAATTAQEAFDIVYNSLKDAGVPLDELNKALAEKFPTATATAKASVDSNITEAQKTVSSSTSKMKSDAESNLAGVKKAAEDASDDRFSDYQFNRARFAIYANLQLSDKLETIKKGTYIVSKKPTTGAKINLTLLDLMSKADKTYKSSLSFPCSVGEVLREACQRSGIALGDANFTNSDFKVKKKPTSTTYRAVIGMVAALAGGNARIDENDLLRIVTFKEISTTTAVDHELAAVKNVNYDLDAITVSGVKCDDTFYGEEGYVLDLKDNQLVATNKKDALARIGKILNGFTILPFSLTSIAIVYATFGDTVQFKDTKGNAHVEELEDEIDITESLCRPYTDADDEEVFK